MQSLVKEREEKTVEPSAAPDAQTARAGRLSRYAAPNASVGFVQKLEGHCRVLLQTIGVLIHWRTVIGYAIQENSL